MTVYVLDVEVHRKARKELAGVCRELMGKHDPAMALVQVSALPAGGACLIDMASSERKPTPAPLAGFTIRPETSRGQENALERPMTIRGAAVDAIRALVLAGLLASPVPAQQPAHAVYYSLPSWAPDGRTIAFESNRDGEAAVYIIRPDGSGLTRLTPRGSPGEQPNWSPDGRHVVFASSRDGVRQLYLMKPDGSDVVGLPGTGNGFLAAFSPDGRWLLFAAQDKRPSSQYRVFVMHPDGSNRRQLGDSTKSNEDPRWTVDGERVMFTEVPVLERLPDEAPRDFVRRRTAAQRLFSITPDGLDVRALQAEEANRMSRDRGVSPDGKWVVYSKQVEGVTGLYLQEQPSGIERLLDRGSRQP